MVTLSVGFEALTRTALSGKSALVSKPGADPVASAHVADGEFTIGIDSQKSPTDIGFVLCSEEYSYLDPSPEPIRAGEWRDLTFFARPIHQPGEEYLKGFERALNQSNVPVELRSKSKYRLAWIDVSSCEKMWCANGLMRGLWPRLRRLLRKSQARPSRLS